MIVEALRPPVAVRAGLMVAILAVGMGPPDVLARAPKGDARSAYPLGLEVALLAIAVVYIPAAVALHGAVFHHDVRIEPAAIVRIVLVQMLVPLALGALASRVLRPRAARRVRKVAERFVRIVMLFVPIVAALVGWRSLSALGPSAWAVCVVVACVALLIGHVAGSADEETRPVLVAFSSVRYPAFALLLSSAVPGGRALVPVILAYLITSAVLLGLYELVIAASSRVVFPRLRARG